MNGEFNFKTFNDTKNSPNRFIWSGKIGSLYTTQGLVTRNNESRYSLGVGAAPNLPQQGFNLNMVSNELDLDAWQEFFDVKKTSRNQENASSSGNIQITAQVKKLTLFDRAWQDVNLLAENQKNGWDLRLSSQQAAGQIQYQESSKMQSSGHLNGRLTKLRIPDAITEPAPKTSSSANKPLTPQSFPSMDVTIDDFAWSKAQLGQLKIKTKTSDNTLKIDSIQTNNPQGSTTITGQWNGAPKNGVDHTSLNIDMNVKDAGQLIAHWTTQKSIENGQGKVSGSIEWDGSPFNAKFETLSGKANINLEKGRFLEVNSSGAKLLDVLSLQSLFRFATLDLKGSLGNIVTKGTPFNSISSNFEISNGIAQAQEFNMNLDQARVAMSGQINIPKQTQDLRITIFPTIDATAGSLAAFAINPIVGLGALVGQYLLTSQINRGLQSDYLVQGSWEDPEIIPLDQKGQPIDPKTLGTIRSKELLKEQSKPDMNNAPSPAPQNNSGNSP
jgi:uncharacterized protein YhdP